MKQAWFLRRNIQHNKWRIERKRMFMLFGFD